jgi:hypothetical protein
VAHDLARERGINDAGSSLQGDDHLTVCERDIPPATRLSDVRIWFVAAGDCDEGFAEIAEREAEGAARDAESQARQERQAVLDDGPWLFPAPEGARSVQPPTEAFPALERPGTGLFKGRRGPEVLSGPIPPATPTEDHDPVGVHRERALDVRLVVTYDAGRSAPS